MSKGCGAAHGWVNIYRESAEHIARLKREDEEHKTLWPDFVTDRAASHQSLEHTSKLIEALTAASWIAYVVDGRMDMGSVVKMDQKHQRIDTSKAAVEQLVRQLHGIQTLLMEREQKRVNDGVQTIVAAVEREEDDDNDESGHANRDTHHRQRDTEREIERGGESASDEENNDGTCIVS